MSPAQAAVPHHNPRRLPLCSRLLLRQNTSDSIKATLAMVWEFENRRGSEHLNTRPSQEKLQKHFPPTRRLMRPQRTHNCSGTITGLRHKPDPERQSWLPSWLHGVCLTQLCRGNFKPFQEDTLRPHQAAPAVLRRNKKQGQMRESTRFSKTSCCLNALVEKEWNKI